MPGGSGKTMAARTEVKRKGLLSPETAKKFSEYRQRWGMQSPEERRQTCLCASAGE